MKIQMTRKELRCVIKSLVYGDTILSIDGKRVDGCVRFIFNIPRTNIKSPIELIVEKEEE